MTHDTVSQTSSAQILELLHSLSQATQIPTHLFYLGQLVGEAGEQSPFVQDPQLFTQLSMPPGCHLLLDDYGHGVYYGLLRPIEASIEGYNILLGPCVTLPVSFQVSLGYLRAHNMANWQDWALSCVSPVRMRAALALLWHLLCPEQAVPDLALPGWAEPDTKPERIPDTDIQSYLEIHRDAAILHHTYQSEQLYYDAVRQADRAKLRQLSQDFPIETVGAMATTPDKQLEYSAVLHISFMVRAAIQAGVHPFLAYAIHDRYLQELSKTQDPDRYLSLIQAATEHLLDEIERAHHSQGSPHVQRAREFIQRHLTEPFTMQQLADQIGIRPNYLSTLFHKETGVTLQAYTRQQRLKASCYLLEATDTPLNDIAAQYCFSSSSHYAAAFQAHFGLTPRRIGAPTT